MHDSSDSSVKTLMAQAEELSRKYDWTSAATVYQKIIDENIAGQNPSDVGDFLELLARCWFKAAFQSQTRQEFKQKMGRASGYYERATHSYRIAGAESSSDRAEARRIFAQFWAEDDPGPRRVLIKNAIASIEKSAETSERNGDTRSLAEAHRDLLDYLSEALELCSQHATAKEYFYKTLELGEKATKEFQPSTDDELLVERLSHTLYLLSFWFDYLLDPSEAAGMAQRSEKISRDLAEAAQRAATPYALSLANYAIALTVANFEADLSKPSGWSKPVSLLEQGLAHATKTGDSLITGHILGLSSWMCSAWGAIEDDVEERRKILEKAKQLASDAIRNLKIPFWGGWLALVTTLHADCYTLLAKVVDIDAKDKTANLQKAIEIAKSGQAYEDYGLMGLSTLPRAMHLLATITPDQEDKERLLKDALPTQEKVIRKLEALLNPDSYELGRQRIVLAQIKAELSSVIPEQYLKIDLVQSAASDIQHALETYEKWSKTSAKGVQIGAQHHYEVYGNTLVRLYSLTNNIAIAHEAVKAFEDAIRLATKAGLVSPLAPLLWNVAKVYDGLSDRRRAHEYFKKAAENYMAGAEKLKSSAPAFQELASYMDAWAQIEDARLHHNEEQYLLASEKYTKAAGLLESTKKWAYLRRHYMACSFLEGGEALSRQDRLEPAIKSFTSGLKAFREARVEIETKLASVSTSQEELDLNNWLETTNGGEKLCQARTELEEARLLDHQGEEEASQAKYQSASATFKQLLPDAPDEEARREIETMMLFCNAWALMKQAEVEASPEGYSKASIAFLNARNVSMRKKPRMLALANSSICKALQAGTLFRQTRDTQLYSVIKKDLDAAADYYQQAGFQNAADWTQATQRLFDALVYMADAEVERDPRKKTEFFHLAEKHLQMAASLYGEAGYSSKKEEALRHLKRARGEKELLLTPIEALAENPALTKTVVTPVSLTRDQAAGLEMLEAANVVGNMTVHEKDLRVGSDLMLEVEMANVGRTAATLVKLENIAVEGLELDRDKIPQKVEDNYLDMKGRRLEYLKTHEVKIPLKPKRKGAFELRPRILFVDEKGKYRSYEFEPVALNVTELGISGWLKGPK